MDHPIVMEIERTGYPQGYQQELYGVDALGKEVFKGDEIYVYNDDFFLIETLGGEAKEVLEIIGAEHKEA